MKSQRIVIRIEKDLRDLCLDVAERRGETLSNFIRFAVLMELGRLSYLSLEQKKALALECEEGGL